MPRSNDTGREAAIRYAASLLNQDVDQDAVEAALQRQFPDLSLRDVNHAITQATEAIIRGSQLADPLTSPFATPGRGITGGFLMGEDYDWSVEIVITEPLTGRVLTFTRTFTATPEDANDIAEGIGNNIWNNLARKYGWPIGQSPVFSTTINYAL